jgi:IS30 family transposase
LPAGAIRRAQNLLNDRPRKVLNYRTPHEAFTTLVALDS